MPVAVTRPGGAVRQRFAKLLRVLAEAFDGRIAGLNLAETSIGFGSSGKLHPPGYSNDAYFEGIKDLMSSALSSTPGESRAMSTTQVRKPTMDDLARIRLGGSMGREC